jgi:hypothetical protein
VAVDAIAKEYETLDFNQLMRGCGEYSELDTLLEKGSLLWKKLAKALDYNDQMIVYFENTAAGWPDSTPLAEMMRFWRNTGIPLVSSLDKAVTETGFYSFKRCLVSWLIAYWDPKQKVTFVQTDDRLHPYNRNSGPSRKIKPLKQAVSLRDLTFSTVKKHDISKHITSPVVETRFSAVISDFESMDELANALSADIENDTSLTVSHLAEMTGVRADSVDELIEEWKDSPSCIVDTIIAVLGTYRCEHAVIYLIRRSNRHRQVVGRMNEVTTD